MSVVMLRGRLLHGVLPTRPVELRAGHVVFALGESLEGQLVAAGDATLLVPREERAEWLVEEMAQHSAPLPSRLQLMGAGASLTG